MTPLALLRRLAAVRPPLRLMGGCAEEALLHGQLVGTHGDVDVLLPSAEWPACRDQLVELGLAVPAEGAPGQPLEVIEAASAVRAEIWICGREPGGWGLVLPGGLAGTFQLLLPADCFDYPVARLDDFEVHTVSPLALYQLRATSAQTRSTGDRLAADIAIMARLRERFLAGDAEDRLRPRVSGWQDSSLT